MDQIDLYQMHAWDAVTPLQETLRFLDDAVSSGKIAYYGFSKEALINGRARRGVLWRGVPCGIDWLWLWLGKMLS